MPTWVHYYAEGGKNVYNIVPLSSDLDGEKASLGLDKSSTGLALAKESYDRTMKLVSEGVKECNDYLASLPRPDDEPATETTTESVTESVTESATENIG